MTSAHLDRDRAGNGLRFKARLVDGGLWGDWNDTVALATAPNGAAEHRYNSLAVVAGNPAISYYASSSGDLWFIRCVRTTRRALDPPPPLPLLSALATSLRRSDVEAKTHRALDGRARESRPSMTPSAVVRMRDLAPGFFASSCQGPGCGWPVVGRTHPPQHLDQR